MCDALACTVCLSTGVKMYSLDNKMLRDDFLLVSGLPQLERKGMPNYLCVECSAYVKKCIKFRLKCQRAHYALKQILTRSKISMVDLEAVNRQKLQLMPYLSYLNSVNKNLSYDEIKKLVNPIPRSVALQSTLNKENKSKSEQKDNVNKESESNVEIEMDLSKVVQMDVDFNESKDTTSSLTHDAFGSNMSTSKLNLESKSEPSNLRNCVLATKNQLIKEENDACEDSGNNNYESDICDESFNSVSCESNVKIDNITKEYNVDLVVISEKEAKAVDAVKKHFSTGTLVCNCGSKFHHEDSLKLHAQKHDVHKNTPYHCGICDFNFKSTIRLQNHMNNYHIYKYLCRSCPEVTFSKVDAKYHYIQEHFKPKDQTFVKEKKADEEKPPPTEARTCVPIQVIHTGTKRYECDYCQRRFEQKSEVLSHIQDVHMKVPYAERRARQLNQEEKQERCVDQEATNLIIQ